MSDLKRVFEPGLAMGQIFADLRPKCATFAWRVLSLHMLTYFLVGLVAFLALDYDPAISTARPFDNGPFAPSGGTFYYVNLLESSAASNYNGLQAGLNVQNRYGINSTLNFSYGHSIDNASDGQDYVANATQPDNSHRPDLERANSNFDIRKRFSWTISYDFEWTKGAERLTGGWLVSGALSLQSGAPFHVNLFDDYNGTGEYFPRPDLVGDPYAGTHTPDSYLNLSAFAVPCTLDPSGDGSAGSCLPGSYRFGTLGRNSLRGPGYRNFDLALVKTTKVNERLKVQFRAEFFNVFNHPTSVHRSIRVIQRTQA